MKNINKVKGQLARLDSGFKSGSENRERVHVWDICWQRVPELGRGKLGSQVS